MNIKTVRSLIICLPFVIRKYIKADNKRLKRLMFKYPNPIAAPPVENCY